MNQDKPRLAFSATNADAQNARGETGVTSRVEVLEKLIEQVHGNLQQILADALCGRTSVPLVTGTIKMLAPVARSYRRTRWQ